MAENGDDLPKRHIGDGFGGGVCAITVENA